MSANSRWWFVDLLVVLVLAVIGGFVVLADLGGRLRVALVMPLVVFLPGYVLLSALYPSGNTGGGQRTFGTDETDATYNLGGPERLALSVALSVAIVPMIAAATNFTPWGIRVTPIIYGVTVFTVFFAILAFVRRLRVPFHERYSPSVPAMLFSPIGRGDDGGRRALLNVVIVVSFLLVATTAAYAMFNPPQGREFTEFYAETDNVSSDVNSMYQATYPPGETSTLTVNVGNHEESRTSYTVVGVLQRVESGKVTERQRLGEQSVTVGQGKTKQVSLDVQPEMTGDNLRIKLFLYKGDPSGAPYRTSRLWVSVQEGQQGNQEEIDGTSDGLQDDGGSGADTTAPPSDTTTSRTTRPPTDIPTTTTTSGFPTPTTDTTSTTTTFRFSTPTTDTTSTTTTFGFSTPTTGTTTQPPSGTTEVTETATGTTGIRGTTTGAAGRTTETTTGTTRTTTDGFFARNRPEGSGH